MNKPFLLHDETEDMDYRLEIFDIPDISGYHDLDDFLDNVLIDSAEMDYLEHHFGVHDTAYSSETEICGYSSYEWEKDKIPELLNYWKDWLERLGFKTGKWVKSNG